MASIYGFYSGAHDASVVFINNGEIVSAVQEERFSRIKSGDQDVSYAFLSKEYVEQYTGTKMIDADYIATGSPACHKFIKDASLPSIGIKVFDHHECHAKAAYLTSGFEGKCIVFTYDGGGTGTFGSLWLADGGNLHLVKNLHIGVCASLPQLWARSCHGYGWKSNKDEGKIMGMAGNGRYQDSLQTMLKSVIKYEGPGSLNFLPAGNPSLVAHLVNSLSEQGQFSTPEGRFDYAYNLQAVTEDIMLEFICDLKRIFPEHCQQMCFAGGLFANVKLNQKINELNFVNEIYVLPPMGDEGISLGAALSVAHKIGDWPKPKKIRNVFWGKSYEDDFIFKECLNYSFKEERFSPLEAAKLLSAGKIGGFFNGRFEFGPRALGARSIIVQATHRETHDLLNKRLNRHEVMPFAPAILKEKASDVFENAHKSSYSAEFMTNCYTVKEEWRERIPACIHRVDFTGRPQFVNKDSSPQWHELIQAYYGITGIPLILNTSFNGHGEPIIDSPRQAFDHLRKGTIDFLIIGGKIFTNYDS